MFIAGNNRWNSYLFHIGGFNQSDQIRLTKYERIQTLDIHTLEKPLAPHTTYTFTAIKEGSQIQLYMDNQLVINYTDPIPYVGPQHESFGFELVSNSYSISRIQAWDQPLAQKISPIIIADDYFSHGHFQLALDTYDDIRENYSKMAAVALFRSAQCLYNLDKKVDARLRLKQFMRVYPNHPYQVHAFTSLCTIDLDFDNWDRLYSTLHTLGPIFKDRPEAAWLKYVLITAITEKHHLNDVCFELPDPYKSVQDASTEISALDAYFSDQITRIDSIDGHQKIIGQLMRMGRYQEVIDRYPHAQRSATAYIRLGHLETARAINPINVSVLTAHALRHDSAHLTAILNNRDASWSDIAKITSPEFHAFFTPLCPPGHPYLTLRARYKSITQKNINNPNDFDALLELHKYQEAAMLFEEKNINWFEWKYGQTLTLLGREHEVLDSHNPSFQGITRIKAYSSLFMRLWIVGKHQQAQDVHQRLVTYVNDMCSDPAVLIFPFFLDWTRNHDRAALEHNLTQIVQPYMGRYAGLHQKTCAYILGHSSEDDFLTFLRHKINTANISIVLQGMRAEYSGDTQKALNCYARSSLTFDSDRQQFIAWRIQELSGPDHE